MSFIFSRYIFWALFFCADLELSGSKLFTSEKRCSWKIENDGNRINRKRTAKKSLKYWKKVTEIWPGCMCPGKQTSKHWCHKSGIRPARDSWWRGPRWRRTPGGVWGAGTSSQHRRRHSSRRNTLCQDTSRTFSEDLNYEI